MYTRVQFSILGATFILPTAVDAAESVRMQGLLRLPLSAVEHALPLERMRHMHRVSAAKCRGQRQDPVQ